MNNGKERVKLSKVIQKMNLVNLTPQIDVSGIWLNLPDVNRPAFRPSRGWGLSYPGTGR